MNDTLFEGSFHAIIRVASFIDEKNLSCFNCLFIFGCYSSHKYSFEDNWWGMGGGVGLQAPWILKDLVALGKIIIYICWKSKEF